MATLAHIGLDKSAGHLVVSAKKDLLAGLVQSSTAMKLAAASNNS